jgi:hypothetical protein
MQKIKYTQNLSFPGSASYPSSNSIKIEIPELSIYRSGSSLKELIEVILAEVALQYSSKAQIRTLWVSEDFFFLEVKDIASLDLP